MAKKRNIARKPFSHPIDFEVTYLVSKEVKQYPLEGNAVDISSNGIGLLTSAPLNRGEVVKIYVPIVFFKTVLPSYS